MINWFEKHYGISRLITLIIAGTIFYISSLTFQPGTGAPGYLSIIYHFSAFFFFAGFLSISLIKGKSKKRKLIFIVIILAVLYGISDEIHQLFVLGRTCTFEDVLTDSAGILFSAMIYSLRLKFKKK